MELPSSLWMSGDFLMLAQYTKLNVSLISQIISAIKAYLEPTCLMHTPLPLGFFATYASYAFPD